MGETPNSPSLTKVEIKLEEHVNEGSMQLFNGF